MYSLMTAAEIKNDLEKIKAIHYYNYTMNTNRHYSINQTAAVSL